MFTTITTPNVLVRLAGLLLTVLAAAPVAGTAVVMAQDSARERAVRSHVRALEATAGVGVDEALASLEREHFSERYLAGTTSDVRRQLVAEVRSAAADAGDVGVMVHDDGYVLVLEGRVRHEVTFTVEPEAPFRIETIAVVVADGPVAEPAVEITRANLAATFERLERDGWSGVVSVTLDGGKILERAFGQANTALGLPVRLDTVFGTGSRPIDYTAASILLLDQRGRLALDDTIGRFFDDVPADKRAMTVRHLLDGQSGLPDFFHTADDWDPDLAWIDRVTAERRLLAAPLRFAPGTSTAHSHAAFGLLAAIIERVSGQSYQTFVRTEFFEPAGMTRTGFNGETLGLPLDAFAVGGGPQMVGLPNIPPNWGPTSWLVMGSGGMFSTLPDLQRFYALFRSGRVLDAEHAARFNRGFGTRDGSDRGFELFHVYNPPGNEVMLLLNRDGASRGVDAVIDGLARLVRPNAGRN